MIKIRYKQQMGSICGHQLKDDYIILNSLNQVQMMVKKNEKVIWISNSLNDIEPAVKDRFEKYFIVKYESLQTFQGTIDKLEASQRFILIIPETIQVQNLDILNNDLRINTILILKLSQDYENAYYLSEKSEKVCKIDESYTELLRSLKYINIPKIKQRECKNILIKSQKDMSDIRKLRLNFEWMTRQKQYNLEPAFNNLVELLEYVEPQYKSQISKQLQTINPHPQNIIQKHKIWQLVFNNESIAHILKIFPTLTSNCKSIAYIRYLYYLLNQSILQEYKDLSTKPIKTVYIVMLLTQQEKQKLLRSQTNYLVFTTFVKGFTDWKKAKAQQRKIKESLLFTLKFDSSKIYNPKDPGYFIYQNAKNQNIIFHLTNYFYIQVVDLQAQQVGLFYRGVSHAQKLISNPQRIRHQGVSQRKLILCQNSIKWNSKKVNQATSIYLQTKNIHQCLFYYEQCLRHLSYKNATAEQIDKVRLSLADLYLSTNDYEKAKFIYDYIIQKSNDKNLKIIANLHLTELYFKKDNQADLQTSLVYLKNNLELIKLFSISEYFQAKNFIGTQYIRIKAFTIGGNYYKNLYQELMTEKNQSFEATPIYCDIISNLAVCLSNQIDMQEEAGHLLKQLANTMLQAEGQSETYKMTVSNAAIVSSLNKSNRTLNKTFIRATRSQQSSVQYCDL